MNILNWVRTRGVLLADLRHLRALVAEKDRQLAEAGEALKYSNASYVKARNLAAARAVDVTAKQGRIAALETEIAGKNVDIDRLTRKLAAAQAAIDLAATRNPAGQAVYPKRVKP